MLLDHHWKHPRTYLPNIAYLRLDEWWICNCISFLWDVITFPYSPRLLGCVWIIITQRKQRYINTYLCPVLRYIMAAILVGGWFGSSVYVTYWTLSFVPLNMFYMWVIVNVHPKNKCMAVQPCSLSGVESPTQVSMSIIDAFGSLKSTWLTKNTPSSPFYQRSNIFYPLWHFLWISTPYANMI